MDFRLPIQRIAGLAIVLLGSGCVVYRYVPPTGDLTAAQRRWADSVSVLREAELARILVEDAGQRRPRLVRNPVLDSVARARAWDMATRGYFDHVSPDGWGPNALVEAAGYRLPPEYDRRRTGNDIEAAAAGYGTARQAWGWFMRSPLHRTHLLGLDARGRAQTEFGVGYAWRPQSRYGHYWVVLIARPAGADADSR
ncbi:MAG TPA: CAP domain-containing protein [Longimicrobium sp.]|nr:CAP domain-containing protein [Longimicrobium sp.]